MKAETIYTTAESIYTTAESIIKALNADEVAEKLRAPREVWNIYNIWEAAEKLRADAAEEMRREANKQSGRASVARAALRILKRANADVREALHGVNRDAHGLNICDGYALLTLYPATAPELPERPETLIPYIDAARLYEYNTRNHSDPVHLPEPATLREFIKLEKARKKATNDKTKTPPLYSLTTDAGAVIWFNAEFLLDMLEALPSAKAYAADQRASISAIMLEADNGRGILLPVRHD